MPTDRSKALVALLFVQLFFGIHYFAAKIVLVEIEPRTWAVLRSGFAAVFLVSLVLALRRRWPAAGGDWGRLAVYSVFGVVLNQLCFIEGLSRTTATHASILITGIPAGTLLFAVLLRREKATAGKLASLVLSTLGVVLVVRPAAGAEPGSPTLVGDVLVLINALSYAFFLAVSKRVVSRLDPLSSTAALMVFGSLGLAAIGADEWTRFAPSAVPTQIWIWAAFIVVFPTGLGYVLNYWSLKRVEASVVGLFIYLQPVIATTLAVAFLGERLEPVTLLGAALIFGGVWLALYGPGLPGRRAQASASAARSSAPRGSTDSSMSNSGE